MRQRIKFADWFIETGCGVFVCFGLLCFAMSLRTTRKLVRGDIFFIVRACENSQQTFETAVKITGTNGATLVKE